MEVEKEKGDKSSTEATIMAAVSSLTPSQLSDFTHSVSLESLRHQRRLSALLSSPSLFSETLHHLLSLSLPQKTHLISLHILSSLHHLTRFFQTNPFFPPSIRLRDHDALLLLLLLCEIRQYRPKTLERPVDEWRVVLTRYFSDTLLSVSGVNVFPAGVLIGYVDAAAKCGIFVGGKMEREVAAAASAVVELQSVEVRGDGVECAICREEMREGRDVCELPCDHMFHWMCILPWLRKRNTCPCCRSRLPTDDVIGEIERLWEVLVNVRSQDTST